MKVILVFFLFSTFYVMSVTANDSQCAELSKTEHDCSFYTKCLEEKYSCGSNGYPIGYGNKYCSKFLEFYQDFDSQGKSWVDKTLICLKQAIIKEMNRSLSCKELFELAFDSHPDCYVQSGFCDIMLHDTFNTVKALIKVYEIKDFASFSSVKQITLTVGKCGAQASIKFLNALKDILGDKFVNPDADDFNPFNN